MRKPSFPAARRILRFQRFAPRWRTRLDPMHSIRFPRRAALLALAIASLFGGAARAAEDYPSKPLRVVVPYPSGGIADKIAREVAEQLQLRLKQTVVVENRSGAAGNIRFDHVARPPAAGHTPPLAPASNLTVQPALFKNLSYDLARDFAPVSLLVLTPQVLLVNPALPIDSAKDLVAYSKKNPGKVNYG